MMMLRQGAAEAYNPIHDNSIINSGKLSVRSDESSRMAVI
jgi:hypothetical protein